MSPAGGVPSAHESAVRPQGPNYSLLPKRAHSVLNLEVIAASFLLLPPGLEQFPTAVRRVPLELGQLQLQLLILNPLLQIHRAACCRRAIGRSRSHSDVISGLRHGSSVEFAESWEHS